MQLPRKLRDRHAAWSSVSYAGLASRCGGLCAVALALSTAVAQAAAPPQPASAALQTVCTVTINSPDEKEVLKRHLPSSHWRFVELVERGRSDWLADACRAQVRCDVLVISGHFDGSNEFFADDPEVREALTVSELERASCSDACPSLFERLREVYLFGCNTLNPQPLSVASGDVLRSLVRDGQSRQTAERELRNLNTLHGQSSRDLMRAVFSDVGQLYGFASFAPLGPVAAEVLERHYRSDAGAVRDFGLGRRNGALLARFAGFGMASSPGLNGQDALADLRANICRFADDRRSEADKLAFVHELLDQDVAEARLYLDRIERLVAGLPPAGQRPDDVQQSLVSIQRDEEARERFLTFARDADQLEVRVRMIELARSLGWLTADQRWYELALQLRRLQLRHGLGLSEVNLACRLNRSHEFDGLVEPRILPGSSVDNLAHAAVRACLGSAEEHERTLTGLTSPREGDLEIVRAYLRHRPIADPAQLRRLAGTIAGMEAGEPQARALEALARLQPGDPELLRDLTLLYTRTPSWSVQAAIAGVLIRADRRALGALPPLLRTLREHRRPSPPGENLIDALIRRLESS